MVTAETLQQFFNQARTTREFPCNLNFADDTTFYVYDKDLRILLENTFWFENTFKKLNQDKYYLLVCGHKHAWDKISGIRSGKVKNKNCLVLLLIEI